MLLHRTETVDLRGESMKRGGARTTSRASNAEGSKGHEGSLTQPFTYSMATGLIFALFLSQGSGATSESARLEFSHHVGFRDESRLPRMARSRTPLSVSPGRTSAKPLRQGHFVAGRKSGSWFRVKPEEGRFASAKTARCRPNRPAVARGSDFPCRPGRSGKSTGPPRRCRRADSAAGTVLSVGRASPR